MVLPVLSHADLRWMNLSGADLHASDLREANLFLANLNRADLMGAELGRANLSRADLRGVDLTGMDLTEANLSGAIVAGGKLTGTRFVLANLNGASFIEADLRNASFRGANLSRANFQGADMCGADLDRATLVETIFADTNLRDARVDHCEHLGPSSIDHRTLTRSRSLTLPFLRGCGLPDLLIDYLPSLLNQPIQFYSCFISYSHKDKSFARRLHDTLQGRGIRCWLDEKQLLPGDDVYEHVDRGIRLWDKVLLCCSKHSLSSGSVWVDREIAIALEKEEHLTKERGTKVRAIIPLDLDSHIFTDDWRSGYRSEIRRRLAADFTGWEENNGKFENQIENVIRALCSDEGARERPPGSKL